MRAVPFRVFSSPSSPHTGRFPAVGLALLLAIVPKCSACLLAQAALLGGVGIGVLPMRIPWPVTAASLGLAVALLAWKAPRRRGYAPFVVGCAGAALLAWEWMAPHSSHDHVHGAGHLHAAAWIGVALLVAASAWNAWPARGGARGGRGACTTHARDIVPPPTR